MSFLLGPLMFALPYLAVLCVVIIVASVVFKSAKVRSDTYVLKGTSIEASVGIVANLVDGLTEYRFAFPSGVFRRGPTDDQSVEFVEVVYGTVGFEALYLNFRGPLLLVKKSASMVSGSSSLASFFRFVLFAISVLAIIVALMLGAVIAVITAVESIAKWSLRSKITAVFVESPDNPRDTVVRFVLSGPCALLSKDSIAAAFADPSRPVVYA